MPMREVRRRDEKTCSARRQWKPWIRKPWPALLDTHGPFGAAFPGYERRPQQMEMTAAVARAFSESTHLMVEAGTGTGKSLAYLIPAVHWSLRNGERVVISTNTINLQDQLLQKDFPDLIRILGLDARAAVLKGRVELHLPPQVRSDPPARAANSGRDARAVQDHSMADRYGQRGPVGDQPQRPGGTGGLGRAFRGR